MPGAHWLRRTGLYWLLESRVLGFAFAPKINQIAERLVLRHLERSVADPVLRAKLTPAYRMGCKRVLLSNDYYPALQRANVEVVTDAIATIEPTGDPHRRRHVPRGRRDHLRHRLQGRRLSLRDADRRPRWRSISTSAWRQSVRNYLGITVSGFPNLFLLMGPNTGLGHNSMVFMIEAQVRYAVDAIRQMRSQKLATIDVRPEVESAFHAEMQHRLAGTVWTSGCSSWYMAPGGDVLLWPGFTFEYWRRTRSARLDEFRCQTLTDLDAPRATLALRSAAAI